MIGRRGGTTIGRPDGEVSDLKILLKVFFERFLKFDGRDGLVQKIRIQSDGSRWEEI
jgi:hypothetical protein